MLKINFQNNNVKLPFGTKRLVKKACVETLRVEEFNPLTEINVTFVNDEEIRKINKTHRQIDKPTDVLSFPLGENGCYDVNPENNCLLLGDIVISVDTATKQSEEFGHSIRREIAYLTVHSVLHLLGYDHILEADDKKEMRLKEEIVLKRLGLEIEQEGK